MNTHRIKAAAVQYIKTGQVYQDSCHAVAYLHAWEAIDPEATIPCNQFREGFVTSEGAFVDRFEASNIAYQARQTTWNNDGHLISEEIDLS